LNYGHHNPVLERALPEYLVPVASIRASTCPSSPSARSAEAVTKVVTALGSGAGAPCLCITLLRVISRVMSLRDLLVPLVFAVLVVVALGAV
jgi:hypothetical protein